MNNRMQTIRVGLFFVLGLALLWITFESLNGGHVFKERGYTLVARFHNLKGLQKGDDVLMAGVRIGAVSNTLLAGRQAEAMLTIDPGVRIADDAVATVATSSLLGTNHLEVSFGTAGAPPLKPGATIKTRETIDMNEVIAKLGSLGDRMEQVLNDIGQNFKGGGKNGNLFSNLNKLVNEDGPKLTATLSNLQAITGKIRDGQGTIGKLINDDQLNQQLLASVDQIKGAATDARKLIDNAQSMLNQVKSGHGAVGTLLYDHQTAENIRVAVQNLRQITDKLNSDKGTLGRLIGDDQLYRQAEGTMRKVNQAVDSLSDQGPITAVSVAARSLF